MSLRRDDGPVCAQFHMISTRYGGETLIKADVRGAAVKTKLQPQEYLFYAKCLICVSTQPYAAILEYFLKLDCHCVVWQTPVLTSFAKCSTGALAIQEAKGTKTGGQYATDFFEKCVCAFYKQKI